MKNILRFLCVASLVGLTHLGQAQISISGSLPFSYTQNFDILGASNATFTNATPPIPGWFYKISTNGGGDITAFSVFASDGTTAPTPFTYHFGVSNTTERALGSISGLFLGVVNLEHFYGAQFVNNSGATLNKVNLSYTGEQWEDNTASSHTLQFFYRVGGTDFVADINNVGWNSESTLDFTTPHNLAAGPLNGNDIANRVTRTASISGFNIPAGESFWIRWADLLGGNLLTTNQAVAIDDLSVTFNSVLDGVTIELKQPKVGKKVTFKGSKGFKVKGFIFSTSNTVSKASYVAFGGTNTPTNLTFVDAGKFKPLTKGKLFKKKGVDAIFQSTKTTKAGVGITESPVTLLVKVEGGPNNASSVIFTNVFTDVKIK